MNLSVIDILFIVTVVLLVASGLRNGAIISLVSLLGLPVGLFVAYMYGPQFTALLAANGLPATPLISYAVLFLGVVFIVHLIGNAVRGFVKHVPVVSQGDTLLGGAVGFAEAWLIWLLILVVMGTFLGGVQSTLQQGASIIPGLNVELTQFQGWHDFYNQAVTDSLFARVNSVFVRVLPGLPTL